MSKFFNPNNAKCPDWLIGNPDDPVKPRAPRLPNVLGVIQMDADGKELRRFPKVSEAAALLKTSRQSISRAAREGATFAGYRWAAIKRAAS